MKAINLITLLLIIIGGINWGLEALGYNLVEALFGADTGVAKIIYGLVGLSALWQLTPFVKALRTCEVAAEANVRTVVR
ncbi:DUF378 domain-containing protein [Terricaulis sp.]|uniref:DUF378 domain-containing protein n=1 Tax=Terricaulis sp. TaxID=2768686 RepID=UPI002AC6F849|nr:DUF378 domain-containing protein [Terricaulis sp.]MDZ4690268.1 DUF378 domain-containing protein [Terricaulis sp.]